MAKSFCTLIRLLNPQHTKDSFILLLFGGVLNA